MPDDLEPGRHLPNGKFISKLGFGCSSRWSLPSFPDRDAYALLGVAVEKGINHFDTSPSYALSEQRLGHFLKERDPSAFVLSTKVGTEADRTRSFDVPRMSRSFSKSLNRLTVDHVDILYLHGPSKRDLNSSVFKFFDFLKSRGHVSYSGVNSFDPSVVEACADLPIDVVMLQYNFSDRRFDGIIDRLVGAGKTVIAGSILAQGIFEWRTFLPSSRNGLWYLLRGLKNNPLFLIHGHNFARRVQRLGLNPHEAAVRFAVSHPGVTSGLFGTSSMHHLLQNIEAAANPMSPDIQRLLMR